MRFRSLRTACAFMLVTMGWGAAVHAGDVSFHVVAGKVQNLMQTNAAGPLAASTNSSPFQFLSFVSPSGAGTITNVTLTTPTGTNFVLPYVPDDDQFETTNSYYNTKTDLDATFISGLYTQTIYAVTDGTQSVPLTLPPDAYPNDPVISNWPAAQIVNMTTNLLLQWGFAGGTINDFVQLHIQGDMGSVLKTAEAPGLPGALNGTTTSISIPAGTLAPGQTYQGRLLFAKLTGVTNAFPDALGVTTYVKNSEFAMVTALQQDLLFFDGFQQANDGDSLTNASYTPIVGSNAYFEVRSGTPSVIASNFFGNLRAFFDSSVPTNEVRYHAVVPTAPTNGVLDLSWNLWIQATNAGFGGFFCQIVTTNSSGSNHRSALVAFLDSGVIATYTNPVSPTSVIPIGNWSSLAGSVLTNRLTVNYPARTFAFSLNGTVLTNLPLNDYFTNYLDEMRLQMQESLSGQSLGNRFALDDVQISAQPAPDVVRYLVLKGQQFAQTGSVAAVLLAGSPNVFEASVQESSSGTVSSASVQLPSLGTRTLHRDPYDNELRTNELFATTNALNAAYPSGAYTFTINTVHDGTQSPALNLTGDTYPNTPQVSNWSAAQTIDPSTNFTLTWLAFSGGTTSDYVGVNINANTGMSVLQSPDIGAAGALNGTNTSIVIPAGTLGVGTNYNVRLVFGRASTIDLTNYPGAIGVAAYFKEIEFTMGTTIGLDSDSDGMPDSYEVANGLNPLVNDAAGDLDGDGQSNLREFLAGTDPRNPASVFRITRVTRNLGGQTTIQWNSIGGGRYRVQYSDGDAKGAFNGVFTDILRDVDSEIDYSMPGGDSSQSFTDDFTLTGGPPAKTNRWYRIKLVH